MCEEGIENSNGSFLIVDEHYAEAVPPSTTCGKPAHICIYALQTYPDILD